MALLATTDIIRDINAISASLNGNVLIAQARKDLKEELKRSGVSKEERDRLYANFTQQLALGLISQAIGLAKEMPIISQNSEKIKKDIAIAEIHRSKLETKLDRENIILQKQADGFDDDSKYKGARVVGDMISMLAQSDVETPAWMEKYVHNVADDLNS